MKTFYRNTYPASVPFAIAAETPVDRARQTVHWFLAGTAPRQDKVRSRGAARGYMQG